MKKYLRLFCMLLSMTLAAGIATSCGKKEETPQTPAATEITIDSSYTITLPASPTNAEQDAAVKVQSSLRQFGLELPIQGEDASAANEILVGKTARPASADALNGLGAGDFAVKVSGDATAGYKIALAASDDDGIALAAIYFTHTHLKTDAADGSIGKLSATLSYTHRRGDVTIAGKSISTYTILYAKEGSGADKNIEAAKYADTVVVFADLVEKLTGTRPSVAADTTRPADGTPLMLFGNTSLTEDDNAYSRKATPVGTYRTKLLNSGNIILSGHNPCSALAAGEALVNALLGAEEEVTELDVKGEKPLIKVACVGDSITYGTNSTDPSMQNYPVYLQRMLGYDYYVEKYGAPSHSLIETDTQSFLKHEYFQKSRSAKPNVVIVMLGTNDCRTQKWEDSAYKDWSDPARKEAFLTAGQKLIDAYRKANSDVQIIFSTCPTVPQDQWLGTDWTARIKRYGNPAIKTLANSNGCPVIDIFTYSEQHPEMFEGGDGLHPQNEQYEILAKGVYDMVKDIIKKP